jgi:hypothetical protein
MFARILMIFFISSLFASERKERKEVPIDLTQESIDWGAKNNGLHLVDALLRTQYEHPYDDPVTLEWRNKEIRKRLLSVWSPLKIACPCRVKGIEVQYAITVRFTHEEDTLQCTGRETLKFAHKATCPPDKMFQVHSYNSDFSKFAPLTQFQQLAQKGTTRFKVIDKPPKK